MSHYAVIVQNDESKWDDIKGDLYHYPSTYQKILIKGCNVIYYKGKMRNSVFKPQRLSIEPHYFGIGVVGDSIVDPESDKNDRYCEILNYQEFEKAVPIKFGGDYLEVIPEARKANYWRFGVREIDKSTFERILGATSLQGYKIVLPNEHRDLESFSPTEGGKKKRYSTYYERNPFYREKAIEIHGLKCMACGFDYEQFYGEHGKGYIHVHHNKPISQTGPTKINPRTDMSTLCANCHAMVHRRKKITLSVEDVKKLIDSNGRQSA